MTAASPIPCCSTAACSLPCACCRETSVRVRSCAITETRWSEVPGVPLRDLDTPADYEAFVAGRAVAEDEGKDLS